MGATDPPDSAAFDRLTQLYDLLTKLRPFSPAQNARKQRVNEAKIADTASVPLASAAKSVDSMPREGAALDVGPFTAARTGNKPRPKVPANPSRSLRGQRP
jgi:hypothetical protein